MASKPKKRWNKKAADKAEAAKQPTALEAAADQTEAMDPYKEGMTARREGKGSHDCPHVKAEDHSKRVAWLEGWLEIDRAYGPRPAGNKGGTVTREAVRG
jgi:ribosome modulation factor